MTTTTRAGAVSQPGSDLPVRPAVATTFAARTRWAVSDGWTLVRREIEHLVRQPGELASEFILPAILVLLFGYIFGSAITVPGGGDYREYLMPGIFAMQAMMGIGVTITTVASDLTLGVMDRFRSMPMARSAVPIGHTASSLLLGTLNFVAVAACALLVGWRPHLGLWPTVAGFGLLFLFRYAVGWIGVMLGLLFKTEEAADHAVPLLFPFTMVANTFVPTDGMPAWLRVIADWNPISAITNACRELWGNPGFRSGTDVALPLQHPVLTSLIWCAAIIAVAVPVAVWRYGRASR
ncbi:ABC transporter permease [Amycolatopsis sp. VC5-11]|uniref:ABC transporter permease n=1 Tax=Amycolatopsis sp. VC5-11 TaxID=3120156 RepID=UPI0030086C96